jgi:poly(A) polymerase/tRNA nucleotidyltransferase (CCA-adding enzyme)
MKASHFQIPEEVLRVTKALEDGKYEAYLVGGCVRDLITGKSPKDWDITTNATPEEIQGLFTDTYYNNEFGTVGVVIEDTQDPTLKVVEVTPYRTETTYSDARHPDAVAFSDKVEHDLERRDFTVNAIAYRPSKGELIDLFGGSDDLEKKVLRAVGKAEDRFREDGLRIMRAIRLSAELGFSIEPETEAAIRETAPVLDKIAAERIRDELVKLVMSPRPMEGLLVAQRLHILPHILPELEAAVGVDQNQAHSYDVFEHTVRTLQHAADKNFPLQVRLAALLHDLGKPPARRKHAEKDDWTFHGHEVVSARIAKKVLSRLRFSKHLIDEVSTLVRWHMFFSDPEKITLSAVRRMISNVGKDSIWDLMNLRACDRIGTGRPKEHPYRFRKYKSMIEEALRDPISVKMLKIDGTSMMKLTGEAPGPKIGFVLHALLEEVLDDPKRNTESYLETRARELLALPEEALKKLGEAGKEKRDEAEEGELKEIRGRYWVE